MGVPTGLAEELAEDYGSKVSVTEDPTVGTPVEPPSDATPPGEGPPPATAEGEPTAAGAQPAGEPQGEPQPASTASEEADPPKEPAPEAPPAEITEAQAQSLKDWGESLVEEAVTKVRDEEIPRIQSGLDSRIATIQDENALLQKENDDLERQIREDSIKALTPEAQEQMREGWANEDKGKTLDKLSGELDAWHIDLVAKELLTDYGQYGVTADSLRALEIPEDGDPVAVMTNFCKDAQITALENGSKPATTEPAPAQAAQPAPSSPPQDPPAGSKAPSDAGGGGVPPAPVEADGGKGTTAMGNNVATHGWETADKAFAQPAR